MTVWPPPRDPLGQRFLGTVGELREWLRDGAAELGERGELDPEMVEALLCRLESLDRMDLRDDGEEIAWSRNLLERPRTPDELAADEYEET